MPPSSALDSSGGATTAATALLLILKSQLASSTASSLTPDLHNHYPNYHHQVGIAALSLTLKLLSSLSSSQNMLIEVEPNAIPLPWKHEHWKY